MFRLPSMRIGRLFGIPVELNASWFLVFVLVAAGLAFGYFPVDFPGRPVWVDVVNGLVAALLFFASIVLHEVSHSVVARRVGLDVEKVTLFLFGGVAQLSEEPRSPGTEFFMAIAGPAASVVLALVSFLLYVVAVSVGLSDWWWAALPYLATVNLLVAGFNLLPGFPMDGGRVIRSLLWWASGDKRVATRVAGIGGQAVGWLLVAVGLYGAFRGLVGLLWLALLGLFIRALAARTDSALGVAVRRAVTPVESAMLSPVPRLLESDLDGVAWIDTLPTGASGTWAVIDAGGRLVGAVDVEELAFGVGHGLEPPEPRASQTAIPPLVDSRDSLDVAARKLSDGAPAVWVVRDARLVGFVVPSAIEGYQVA